MKVNMRLLCFLLGICAMALTSCATTTLTAVWRDESYQGQVKKIAVVGVFKKTVIRNLFEDEFARELRAHGVDAVPSYTILSIDRLADKDVIASAIVKLKADTVLITRLADKKTVQTYIPGQVYAVPEPYRYWRPYHNYAYNYVYEPGYYIESEYAFAETNLYNTGTEKLIWSARSETLLNESDGSLIKSFVKVAIDRLVADKIIR